MVRLVRSGTPVPVVARQYDALDEYVERLCERFSRNGVAGILTEEDIDRFRVICPPPSGSALTTCTGRTTTATGPKVQAHRQGDCPHGPARRRLPGGLERRGIEDTGVQISRWISSMTGYHYRSAFCTATISWRSTRKASACRSAAGRRT